jgi:hypothetical protein
VNVSARKLRILLLCGTLMLLLTPLALAAVRAVPASTASYLVGARMIRAELAVKSADGALHDFRIDRGKLTKRYAAGQVVLVERDSTKASIKVASSARVLLNGKLVNLRSLRAGMQVAVPRDGDLPSDIVYAAAKTAPAIPAATTQYLLGSRLLRAEIALLTPDAVLHDYLLDRGRIRQVGPYSLTVRETDGTNVPVSVSASARVKLNGKTASFAQLRKGMTATVMRDGSKPVDQIWATGR